MSQELTFTRTLLLFSTTITWNSLNSLLPAFYPTEAEAKGASPSEYGFVFGLLSLAAFIFSPIFGKYGDAVEPKLVYSLGGFIQGLSGVAFGFLDWANDKRTFLGFSYLLRLTGGIGGAACSTSILSILIHLFPKKRGLMSAMINMFIGVGYMIGPVIGSLLFSIGGFGLPFFLMGSLQTVLAFAQIFIVPKTTKQYEILLEHQNETEEEPEENNNLTLKSLLQHPLLLITFLDNCFVTASCGMLESMLEPHLKNSEANATQLEVAMAFVILGTVFMIAAPLAGYIIDKIGEPTYMALTGNLCMSIGSFYLGPAPFLAASPSVEGLFAILPFHSFGVASVTVSTFVRGHRVAMEEGFHDSLATSFIISSMSTASLHLGAYLGPMTSGFMVVAWGFRKTTMAFFGLFIVMIIVNFVEILILSKRSTTNKQQ